MSLTVVEAARSLTHALEGTLHAIPEGSRDNAEHALRRLQDTVLPHLESAGTPVLVIIGGSTGSGKSTLVNSLLGRDVSRTGAVRPTTWHPVLACVPKAREWFLSDRVLLRLTKSEGSDGDNLDAITIVVEKTLQPAVGIVDAPDIGSVENGNRRLAAELLNSADLRVFVTTAARYADAVTRKHLEEATSRGLRVTIVLNRVPPRAAQKIHEGLASLARRRGLDKVAVYTIEEQPLNDGRLSAEVITPIRSYLEGIGRDTEERTAIVRQSLSGAVASPLEETTRTLEAARECNREFKTAASDVEQLAASYAREVFSSSDDDVLRDGVNIHIAGVSGSWGMSKTVSRAFSGLSSHVMSAFRGQAAPSVQIQCDPTGGLVQRLADQYHRAWGEPLHRAHMVVDTSSFDELLDVDAAEQHVHTVVQEWTREVTQTTRGQTESSRVSGRIPMGGINVVTVSLMVVAFTMTGGLTGVKVGVAGASAALSQTILKAYFGEHTVYSLAEQARAALERPAGESLSAVVAPVSASPDRTSDRVLTDKLAMAEKRAREVLV